MKQKKDIIAQKISNFTTIIVRVIWVLVATAVVYVVCDIIDKIIFKTK